MRKNILFFVILVILVLGGLVFFSQEKREKPKDVTILPTLTIHPTTENVVAADYKASFAIFTNSTFREFTAAMYHNQSVDAYIRADNPNIVIIKKNITWDEFFKTLPFKLTRECLTTGIGETFCTDNSSKLRFYLNAIEDPNALDKQINNGDQLLVTYGVENEQLIENQMQRIPVIK